MAGPLALSTEQDVACVDLIGHTARLAQPTNDCKSNIYLDRLVVGGKGILQGAGRGNDSTANRSILAGISIMTSNYGAGKSNATQLTCPRFLILPSISVLQVAMGKPGTAGSQKFFRSNG
ncbi:MAG: hypothetical protein DRQ63_01085 [Gammaproteobacteria bacterium]|nr:MAG: hypothetical protein DRQ63_01085 [Gammaproteobacteria bacterium]